MKNELIKSTTNTHNPIPMQKNKEVKFEEKEIGIIETLNKIEKEDPSTHSIKVDTEFNDLSKTPYSDFPRQINSTKSTVQKENTNTNPNYITPTDKNNQNSLGPIIQSNIDNKPSNKTQGALQVRESPKNLSSKEFKKVSREKNDVSPKNFESNKELKKQNIYNPDHKDSENNYQTGNFNNFRSENMNPSNFKKHHNHESKDSKEIKDLKDLKEYKDNSREFNSSSGQNFKLNQKERLIDLPQQINSNLFSNTTNMSNIVNPLAQEEATDVRMKVNFNKKFKNAKDQIGNIIEKLSLNVINGVNEPFIKNKYKIVVDSFVVIEETKNDFERRPSGFMK